MTKRTRQTPRPRIKELQPKAGAFGMGNFPLGGKIPVSEPLGMAVAGIHPRGFVFE